MPPTPFVSVIIPVYNMSGFISRALTSVMEQSYSNLELIVVDDGSTDDTADTVQSMEVKNLSYIFQENKGLPATRNTGIRSSQGEYIAFLDADDYWHPTKIEKQVAILSSRPEVDVVYCDFISVDTEGRELADQWQPPPRLGKTLFEELLYHNVIAGSASAVMVRATALQDVGLFDEDLHFEEDLDLWQRLAYHHGFFHINENLVYIRSNPGGMQANFEKTEKGRLVFLEKVLSRLPAEFRHLSKRVTCVTFSEILRICLLQRKYSKAWRYYLQGVSLGLWPFYYINLFIFRALIRKIIPDFSGFGSSFTKTQAH